MIINILILLVDEEKEEDGDLFINVMVLRGYYMYS